MQQVAQYIFLFLVGTTVLNFVIAVAARAKTANKEFNLLVFYWLSLFLNFVAVAILSKSTNQIALAFFCNAAPTAIMAKILRNSRNIPTNWPLIIGVEAAGMAVSAFLLLQTNLGFSFSLIPFILTISWPWVYPIYDTLWKNRLEANWIEKGMAIIFITGIASHFAFAFYRLDESAAWWGWSQSIAHYQCLSIFLPLLINHRRENNERKNLELALEKISGRQTITSSVEINDLYRSLELQIGQKEEYSRQLADTNRYLEEEREMNEILIQTISHDLANPMTVVVAYLDMILTGRIAPEEQGKIQEKMRLNLQYAMDMIARIRKTIVTRSNADLIRVAPVDLSIALKRSEMLFEEKLRQKNLRLKIDMPSESTKVMADENALVEHVFANILSNAIKFSYEDSDIVVSVREGTETAEIEFRDFGVGINPKRSEKTRFITTVGTKGEEGTGFGLIVMGYFLRKFKADLKIVPHTADGGRGTSFIINLKKGLTVSPPKAAETANFLS
jgi:signal transduction histidine kinase